MGLTDWVEFDPSIVRGLDYYTRTVFEGWDIKGEFRSIWGGGRYDNLTAEVGGKQRVPGVGFAMGDMVIAEVLKANNKYPKLEINQTQVLVTVFSAELLQNSIEITQKLRKAAINSQIYLEPKTRLDKQIKYADKKGIPWVIIIGQNELKENKLTLKNLKTTKQETVSLEKAIKAITANG